MSDCQTCSGFVAVIDLHDHSSKAIQRRSDFIDHVKAVHGLNEEDTINNVFAQVSAPPEGEVSGG